MELLEVEFLSLGKSYLDTGLGRYQQTLQRHLDPLISVKRKKPRLLCALMPRLSFLRKLPLGIKAHKPGNIVHIPQIMGCGMMLWNSYHPSVATVHDLGVLELPEERQMLDPISRQVLRLSLAGLKKVDVIVTVSEFTRQSVIRRLAVAPERVVTIHSGIDHAIFRPVPEAREQLINKYPDLASHSAAAFPWLLYVGSELPRKNLATLLEAVAILKESYPKICLLKVGWACGEQFRTQTQQAIKRLGLEKAVLFFEGISDADLARFYAAADVFVQPSKLEGFGFPVLEAMACGTPVVCANSGSLPEIVGDAAIVANPNAPAEFARAISSILDDSDRQLDMRQKGYVQASTFTWQQCGEQLVDVYRSLAYQGMAQMRRSNSGKV